MRRGPAARRASGIAAHVLPGPLSAQGARPSVAVPTGFDLLPSEEQDGDIAGHLRWLEQKDALGQDVLLLGPPGALRRHLALRFCELRGREAEVLTVTRDTTEADLKQRRELSTGPAGTQTLYADGAPVRCAIKGRVLILDGLEKAERNVLPTINNLLENREMSLDDGRFLVAARRYDALPPGSTDSRLVRVHENFRVIALSLPCPPCAGNPLDPPLRSRFQARVIAPPVLASPQQLGSFGTSLPEVLLKRLAAMQQALNAHALGGEAAIEALVASLPPGTRPPVLTHDALLRTLRLISGAGVLPEMLRPTVADALSRAYPLALLASSAAGTGSSSALTEAAAQWLRHFQLDSGAARAGAPLLELRSAEPLGGDSGPDTTLLLDFAGGGPAVPLASPALPAPPAGSGIEPFVESPPLRHLIAALSQDFAVGHDCLLIGPPGCGKSALMRRVAALLGHGAPGGRGLEFFFLYEEMSSRDLLQRRNTDAAGRTIWVDSPLVRAARSGALCVLDGTHRLRGDVLCALAPLLQDRQVALAVANDPSGAESELLLSAERYGRVRAQLQQDGTYDPAAKCRVARVHPAFRVLALAEPPTARMPWLSDELSTCFSHHVYPIPSTGELAGILASLFPQLPTSIGQRLVAALAPVEPMDSAAGGSTPAAPVPLRVLIRVARRAAAAQGAAGVEAELLTGILQQALFPFMPRGERAGLLGRLSKHFSPKDVAAAAARALRSGGARHRRSSVPPSPAPPGGGSEGVGASMATATGPAAASGGGSAVQIGSFSAPRSRPQHPELVPDVDFVDIGRHVELLEDLARALFERGEQHLLLLGPQGVGKNRVVDHLLQLLGLEREYMQLHRDTTVAQLTVTPTVTDGRLLYEDSPLIRAAQHGRVLVLDEADKAPLEVVVVLKSLVEDGQLALPDGRRLARSAEAAAVGEAHRGPGGDAAAGQPPSPVVPIHPAFRMLVLANRPGFPFLGNDLIREADVFTVFCLDNPDAASELQLVRAIGPNVPEAVLRTLAGIFADLRLAVEEGRLQYPYSTRELLAVVRHLNMYPDEPLENALASILAFDRFDPQVRETLRPIFEKRGVPIAGALGAPLDGSGSPELQQPWLRALAVLRSVKLAATEPLSRPVLAGHWRNTAPTDIAARVEEVQARPAIFDPPRTLELAGLGFDRIKEGFSESVVRARLPINPRAGAVIDGVAAATSLDAVDGGGSGRTLHLLSTMPLCIWTIEDPLAVGSQAGRCSLLPIGPSSDWVLQMQADSPGGAPSATVNGRTIPLGSPQIAWVPGASALLLHSPLDVLAPQILIQRPHREDLAAEILVARPLVPERAAGKVRPRVEESFVAVPCAAAGRQSPEEGEGAEEAADFAAASSVVFFQPSGRRLVQLDAVNRKVRELALPPAPAAGTSPADQGGGLLGRLRSVVPGASTVAPAFSVTALATLRGVEVAISEAVPGGPAATRSLVILLPEAAGDGAARLPTARWIEGEAAGPPTAMNFVPLPAVASAGLITTPFSTADPVNFAALSPAVGLAHVLAGERAEDGRRSVSALHEREKAGTQRFRTAMPNVSLPSIAELAKANGKQLKKMLLTPPPVLPSARWECKSKDTAATTDLDLIVRVLEQPDAECDWIEAVHVQSRSVRRLPSRAQEDLDADLGGGPKAGVARVLPWPAPADLGGSQPDLCVVFRDGSVRWLELHPGRLGQSLREYLEVRGLRGLLDERPQRQGGGASADAEEEDGGDDDDEEDEEEDADDEDDDDDDEEEEEIEMEEMDDDEPEERRPGKRRSRAGRRATRRAARRAARLQRGRGGGEVDGEAAPVGEGDGDGLPPQGGPERLRARVIREARRQRRRILEQQQREERRREQAREASGKPKHGDEDDQEHVGGNRWAGGSGGADTAGLGGLGGPYRLEKKNQNVHQISDEAKQQISEEAREAARKMGEEARQKRMQEIEMDGGDYDLYTTILGEVQGEIEQIRRVLGAAAARQRERVWHRGAEGELDENRLVDAIAGESAVFKRRAERESRPGEVLMQPKRITFLFDTSASMYRFNGADGRLRRCCETALMLMEALRGFEQKFDYEICCHDGDHVLSELVPFGKPPADERERLKVISKMLAHAQYCGSGDNTLPAIERACERIAASGPADDYFVFAFSDANFARYGITGEALARALSGGSGRRVNAVCFFIATFEDEALALSQRMPDKVKVCLDLKALPAELREQFVSSVARAGRSAL